VAILMPRMPAHSPLSIFNCFLTLLEEPNINSPANLDASVMWRDRRQEFCNKAKEIVELSKKNLPAGMHSFIYIYAIFVFHFRLNCVAFLSLLGILEKLPRPDSDPLQRARRIKDKMDLLDPNDKLYATKKAQLEKVCVSTRFFFNFVLVIIISELRCYSFYFFFIYFFYLFLFLFYFILFYFILFLFIYFIDFYFQFLI
jgi:hypothetical protein